MTPPPGTTDDVMVADAAALVRVVAADDLPEGFIIITAPLQGPILGVVAGTGHAMAAAHGARYGEAGVWVDVARFTRSGITPGVVARFTGVVLHEVAHGLTAERESSTPAAAAAMIARVQATPCADAVQSARHHCPRWAAAYVVLLDRALPFRRGIREQLEHHVRCDLAAYGHDLAAVRRVIGTTPEGPLRSRLAAGGAWAQVLVRALPPEAERAGAVLRTLTSAGIAATGAA